jgi:hypothetical protein
VATNDDQCLRIGHLIDQVMVVSTTGKALLAGNSTPRTCGAP